MREPTDNPVPEEVAGEIEALIKGEGPFEEAKEEMLLETEEIEEPEVQKDSSESEMESRLSAIEQALLDVPVIPPPILLPDDQPSGVIVPYGGNTVPDGFLICDGAEISRTDYAELFAAIGELWGAGDSSTTFNVPDLDGIALRGFGTDPFDAVGATGGLTKHDLDHLHTISFVLENGGLGSGSIDFLHTPSVLSSPDWSAAAATYRPDGNHEVDNRGPWACVKYIIRI